MNYNAPTREWDVFQIRHCLKHWDHEHENYNGSATIHWT